MFAVLLEGETCGGFQHKTVLDLACMQHDSIDVFLEADKD